MTEIKLIPAMDRRVPLEDGRDWPLDQKGKPMAALVEDSLYYRRRVDDGDLVAAEEDAPAAIDGVDPATLVAPETPPAEPPAPPTETGANGRRTSNAGTPGKNGEN